MPFLNVTDNISLIPRFTRTLKRFSLPLVGSVGSSIVHSKNRPLRDEPVGEQVYC